MRCSIPLLALGAGLRSVTASSSGSSNSTWPYHTYTSVDFQPPVLEISRNISASSNGYLFFAPDGPTAHSVAPFIATADGDLVWNGPSRHAFNFGVQEYQREPVLVGWNGTVYAEPIGRGNGYVSIWNHHYEIIKNVTLPGNFLEQVPGATYASNIDVHEAYITEKGSLIVTANNVTQTDLSSVGGPEDGWIVEAQVYEIDIASNDVLFAWKSLDHLDKAPLTASLYKLGSDGQDGTSQSTAWGYFHINSASPYGSGYIISSRFLCSALALDASGAVQWRLSGHDGADFTLDKGADFCFQHDVRVVNPTASPSSHLTLHLHDNHNSGVQYGVVPTKGKTLALDLTTHHASLVQSYHNASNPTYVYAQGSFQHLPANNHIVLGHGYIPLIEEYSPTGAILSTIQFGVTNHTHGATYSFPSDPTFSYRAFKSPAWTGCPLTPPAVALRSLTDPAGSQVFISWNGATEVAAWEIYGGIESPSYITTVPATGFETVANTSVIEFVQVKPILRNTTRTEGKPLPSDCVAVESALVFEPGLL